MSSHGPPTPRASRVRPGFRRVALVVMVILLVVLGHRAWDYVELRKLAQAIESIRERHEPLSASDIRQGDGPPGIGVRDAGDYYAAAAMLALSTGEVLKANAALAPLRGWLGGAGPQPAEIARTVMAVRTGLEDWSPALELIDEGATLAFRGFPPGTEFNYRAAGVSNLSRLVADRTMALSLAGEGDDAVASAISGIRLRRAWRDIVGLARGEHEVAAILSFARPSTPALIRLQEALEQEEQADTPAEDLLRERARHLDRYLLTFYGTDPRAPLLYPPPARRGQPLLARPLLTHELVEALQVWAELIEAARTPWPGRADAVAAIRARYPEESMPRAAGSGRQVLSALTLARAVVRPDALILDRSARIAIATERFRRDRGTLPVRLEDLVPAYLATVPRDPWTARELIFNATSSAYAVYSVGPDLQDDGGALLREAPATSAGRFTPADDIGVRVLIGASVGPLTTQPDAGR